MNEDEMAYMKAVEDLEDVRDQLRRPHLGMKFSELRALEQRESTLETIIAELEETLWMDHLDAGSSTKALCPSCKSENVIHTECGDYCYVCNCQEPDEFYCGWCNHTFTSETGALSVMEELSQLTLSDVYLSKSPSPSPSSSPIGAKKSCNHVHQKVELPDGTVVRCTAHHNASKINEKPDFGLYADSVWVRTCKWRNEIINWPDMQLPVDFDLAIEQIDDAFLKADKDIHVDIGCIGAHGRTGTILAIMVLLATEGSMTASEAVKWVRDNYCSHAIETARQEWYVAYAAGLLFGVDVPEEPVAAPVGNSACGAAEHLAMYDAGLKECVKPSCSWWSKDMTELQSLGTIAGVDRETLKNNFTYNAFLTMYNETKEQSFV